MAVDSPALEENLNQKVIMNENNHGFLYAHRMGIDTYKQAIAFIRSDSNVCRSEGFESLARVRLVTAEKSIVVTLNMVEGEFLHRNQIGLSEFAWEMLGVDEGTEIILLHQPELASLSHVRSKIYGNELNATQISEVITDISKGYYTDIHMSAFLTASAGGRLSTNEIIGLTQAMLKAGGKLVWSYAPIVDKHCIGGVPGNRTTLIVVPIVAAFGLTIPKTSSRSITSPAGTADTMEVLAPVNLNLAQMRKVVEQESGCIVWGGAVDLSPADDTLIRVERVLDLDNEGQLVASVLSKKIAAGSTHVVIDAPIGPTVKLRSQAAAEILKKQFLQVGKALGINIELVFTDGSKPVGRGMGPSLEAKDVLAVLQNNKDAPEDLRDRALLLAGKVLEFSPKVAPGTGRGIAEEILTSGKAWSKFQAICSAQGGLFEPDTAKYQQVITADKAGIIKVVNNRRLATIAKLAGAPKTKVAGVLLHTNVGDKVEVGQPLYTVHANSSGELEYALTTINLQNNIMQIEST